MDKYICESCDKTFMRKENLDYHVNNKSCKERNYNCKICGKAFASKSSMYRHVRENCKIKKQNEEEKNIIYERLLKLEEDSKKLKERDKEILLLKKEMKMIKTNMKSSGNVNNGIINVNNGTVVNNITLVGYGNEDMSKLDKTDMLKVLRKGYHSTLELTEALHFNPKYPEYHNIYISNIKDKYAMMYDGTSWTLTMKNDLIDKIYDDKKNYIEENFDDFLASLSLSRRKALERWLETDEDDKKVSEIKDGIKLLLYNKKHMAIQSIDNLNHVELPSRLYVKNRKTIKDG